MVVKIKAWTWHFVCFLVGSDFPHSSFCPSVLWSLRLLLFWFMLHLSNTIWLIPVYILYAVKLERSQCYCNLLFWTVSKCTTYYITGETNQDRGKDNGADENVQKGLPEPLWLFILEVIAAVSLLCLLTLCTMTGLRRCRARSSGSGPVFHGQEL